MVIRKKTTKAKKAKAKPGKTGKKAPGKAVKKTAAKKTVAKKPKTAKLKVPVDKAKLKLAEAKKKELLKAQIAKQLAQQEKIKRDDDFKKVNVILGDSYIRQVLIEVGGENALAIVRNFYGNHSDEELAKKLKIKISDVRATLNKLHNQGLVNYSRQKDSETGWYSYSWTLNRERMEKWATDQTEKISGDDDGGAEKYFCPSCGASTISCFEDAATDNFRCCHCNRMLEFLDKAKMGEIFDRKRF